MLHKINNFTIFGKIYFHPFGFFNKFENNIVINYLKCQDFSKCKNKIIINLIIDLDIENN